METIATLFSTLPHHTDCGMFGNPRTAPDWEARYGPRFPTDLLTAGIAHLRAANARNTNVEWGDVRERHINSSWAEFLEFVIARRSA